MYKKSGPKDVELSEIGPRFEMKREKKPVVGSDTWSIDLSYCWWLYLVYEIRLGTMEQTEADVEWRLRPYMNTSRKRTALSSEHLLDQ